MKPSINFWLRVDASKTYSATLQVPDSRGWRVAYAPLRDSEGNHSIGVHLYGRLWPGGVREIAIRRSNGLVRRDGTGAVGRLGFEAMGFDLSTSDAGAILWAPPRFGQKLVAKGVVDAEGGGHVWRPRWILERRALIVPAGQDPEKAARRVWGFEWVKFESRRKSFGPAREAFPEIDEALFDPPFRAAADGLEAALAMGAGFKAPGLLPNHDAPLTDVRGPALGPWNGDGDPSAGAPAGYEIDLAPGWAAIPSALRLSLWKHEASMARNPCALYEVDSGAPIDPETWLSLSLSQPQLTKTDPFVNGQLELVPFLSGTYSTYSYKVANDLPCAYEAELAEYKGDDAAHSIRATNDATALAYYADDAMAADDLRMLFRNLAHFDWSPRLDAPTASTGWIPQSLTRLEAEVAANPGVGHYRMDRAFGWMIGLATLAAKWDSTASFWLQRALRTYASANDSAGIPQREYHVPYMPSDVLGTQHFHSAIVHAAAIRGARSLFDDELLDAVLDDVREWARSAFENPEMPLQERPDGPGTFGPPKWWWRYRASAGGELAPTLANSSGPSTGFQEHCLAVLGLASQTFLARGETRLAKKMLADGLGVGGPAPDLAAKRAGIMSYVHDLGQFASYVAAIDALPA